MTVTWSVEQAAEAWMVSRSCVNKWRLQGRVPWKRVSGRIVITDSTKPAQATRGSLTKAQRRAWPKGELA